MAVKQLCLNVCVQRRTNQFGCRQKN